MTNIIVGTDLSDNARDAAHWAFGCARLVDDHDNPAHVRVVHVVSRDDMELRRVIANHREQTERDALKKNTEDWLADVDTEDVDYDIEIRIGRPAQTLAELADKKSADWLVVGKSGKGRLARLFVGSTTEDLALRPPCPMAIIHPDGFSWDQSLRVLSAVDLSKSSIDGVKKGADLVRRFGGELRILHVVSLPQGISPVIEGPQSIPETLQPHIDEATTWAREEFDAMIAQQDVALDDLSATVDIRPGYPIHEVLDVVDETNTNLLTLGSHGRSRFAGFMLGGTGRSLLKKAPCTVLLNPPLTSGKQGQNPAIDDGES